MRLTACSAPGFDALVDDTPLLPVAPEADAVDAVLTGRVDAAFYMRGIPVEQIQRIAATGENMPPKSTYFYPKIPTGLVFNPLE